jgi:serpin B
LLAGLQGGAGEDNRLVMSNMLWGQKGRLFESDLLSVVGLNYGGAFRLADFSGDPAGAAQQINDAVAEATQGRIRDLLSGPLDPQTRLVLTNAIYFKGRWQKAFDKTETRDMPFDAPARGDRKGPVDVPTMRQTDEFRYFEDENVQVLELPYRGDLLSMVIVLPRRREADSLAAVERMLDNNALGTWIARLRSRRVEVHLPRFTQTCEFNLSGQLAAMGIIDAFRPADADFSGMRSEKDLFLSAVLHKAFVEVNEEGTEAAAATAGMMLFGEADEPPPPAVFRADHPFLFIIRSRSNGSLLFMGRVSDPTS